MNPKDNRYNPEKRTEILADDILRERLHLVILAHADLEAYAQAGVNSTSSLTDQWADNVHQIIQPQQANQPEVANRVVNPIYGHRDNMVAEAARGPQGVDGKNVINLDEVRGQTQREAQPSAQSLANMHEELGMTG